MHYGLSALVVRLTILRLEGLESDPLPNHTKDLKMGPNASLLGTQHLRDSLGVRPCNRLVYCQGGILVHQVASLYRRKAPARMSHSGSHKPKLMQGYLLWGLWVVCD